MQRVLVLALSALAFLAIGYSPAKAETTVFEDGFFFITGPAVFDDIYVGAGAIVGLSDDILVTGDIEVSGGAWLSTSRITVLGDIEFEGAAIVDLGLTVVHGDVEVTETGGEAVLGLLPTIFVVKCSIDGDLEVKNNNVNSINIVDNVIGGKLELKRNTSNFSNISNNVTRAKKSSKK